MTGENPTRSNPRALLCFFIKFCRETFDIFGPLLLSMLAISLVIAFANSKLTQGGYATC